MQKLYSFDRVHDTTRVYRKLMNAFSHPGKKENILDGIGEFGEPIPPTHAFLAVAATLLDAEVSFFVMENPELVDKISEITHCKQTMLTGADYIFAPVALDNATLEAVFANVKHGTYIDPHTSATVILFAPDEDYVKNTVLLRGEQNIEYPLGIDLIFLLNEAELVAVPRLFKGVL